MTHTMTPEQRTRKNEAARLRRAAKFADKQREANPIEDAVIIDEFVASDVPAVMPDIRHIEAAIEENIQHAESFVDKLIDAQSVADHSEHGAIVAMVAEIRAGNASVKAFVACYAERAALRGMSEATIKARKSNLKGVLTDLLNNAEFEAKFMADDSLGLQAAYKLRGEMNKPEATDDESGVTGGSDDEVEDMPAPNAHEALRNALRAAIVCAEVAKRDDIAEDLREVMEKLMGAVEA
jgi:hypothetical protein